MAALECCSQLSSTLCLLFLCVSVRWLANRENIFSLGFAFLSPRMTTSLFQDKNLICNDIFFRNLEHVIGLIKEHLS